MLDTIRSFLLTAATKPATKSPVTPQRKPATLAAEIKTLNESFNYGNGGISVQLRLSADRQAEFEKRLTQIKVARDSSIDRAQRTCDETCKAANNARNESVAAETDAFAHALRNLFLVFGQAAPAQPKIKDDKELSIPVSVSKQKPSDIIARARRPGRAENGLWPNALPPLPLPAPASAGGTTPPSIPVSKPEPTKAITSETEK